MRLILLTCILGLMVGCEDIKRNPRTAGTIGGGVAGAAIGAAVDKDHPAEGAVIGGRTRGLIVTDEMNDAVFFGRPAGSRPNSTATIFVLEGESRARRATVRYGVMSGSLIQVLDGLTPGDKVIVTDMSKWADFPSVRLE